MGCSCFSSLKRWSSGKCELPSTRITTGTWARNNKGEIIEAVQSALLSALEIPDYDRDVVLDVYDVAARIVPTGRSERYMRIEIVLAVHLTQSAHCIRTSFPIYLLLEYLQKRSRSFCLRCRRRIGDLEGVNPHRRSILASGSMSSRISRHL